MEKFDAQLKKKQRKNNDNFLYLPVKGRMNFARSSAKTNKIFINDANFQYKISIGYITGY